MKKLTLLLVIIIFISCKTGNITQYPIGNNFDLNIVEGQRMFFAPQHVENLRVIVCGEHFPNGSQALENVRNAIAVFNNTPYIKIKFRAQINLTATHIPETELYTCGQNRHPIFNDNDIYIYMAETAFNKDGCGLMTDDPNTPNDESVPGATAYVAKYVNTNNEWTCCTNEIGVAYDKAILCLKKGNFSDYFNDITRSGNAPSTGIITHEMGHMFHMGHNSGNGPLNKRDNYHQIFDGLCNWVGNIDWSTGPRSSDWQHDFDKRAPRITAYTRAVFDAKYPLQNTNEDELFEWTIHQILNFRDSNNIVSDRSLKFFSLANPSSLNWSGSNLTDTNTSNNAIFNMQFSNPSNKSILTNPKNLRIEISLNDNLGNRVILIDQEVTIKFNGFLSQFNFTGESENLNTGMFSALSGTSFTIQYKIDSNNRYTEFDETNNILEHSVNFSRL